MKVTMKEIAREAGVHTSTVYKVLHNRVGVSDEVRKRVQEIIAEKGYKPNPTGRILQKQGIVFKIDVLLLEVDAGYYIREGIRQVIRNHPEYSVTIREHATRFQDIESQLALLKESIDSRADGIIISPNNAPAIREEIDRAGSLGIPVITVNCDIDESSRLCYVGQDGVRGARIAGRIMDLLLKGRGKIAVITNSVSSENNDFHVKTREQEFRRFLEENCPELTIAGYIESLEDKAVTYAKSLELFHNTPDLDGVYITCGGVAEVGRALKEAGMEHRVKVVCFEDYPEILELLDQEVVDCTLGGNIKEQGSRSLEILMDDLLFEKKPESRYAYTDIRILVKESIY